MLEGERCSGQIAKEIWIGRRIGGVRGLGWGRISRGQLGVVAIETQPCRARAIRCLCSAAQMQVPVVCVALSSAKDGLEEREEGGCGSWQAAAGAAEMQMQER